MDTTTINMKDFTVIDFGTANNERTSVYCLVICRYTIKS